MGNRAMRQRRPTLRLVVDNAGARTILMPILDVERRLEHVERVLRRPGLAAGPRHMLLEMRTLLRCELAARPFDPALARRCEHRLRWVERTLALSRSDRPTSMLKRARAALGAILPTPLAST